MALLRVTDRTTSMESLIHAVLIIEQMLTTGGGWQDNVGGLVPGFKIGRSQASLPLKVEWEKLELSEKTVEEMTKRLVCFYSGRTRLAKNLLQVKYGVVGGGGGVTRNVPSSSIALPTTKIQNWLLHAKI